MATFNKFNTFVQALGEEKHTLDTDTLQIALCNSSNAPVATNSVLANLTQIAYTNLSTQVLSSSATWTNSSGTSKLVIPDLVLTASGNVATFRYVVLFNQSAPNDELIGWYDYGSDITLLNGDNITLDFDGSNGALTVA